MVFFFFFFLSWKFEMVKGVMEGFLSCSLRPCVGTITINNIRYTRYTVHGTPCGTTVLWYRLSFFVVGEDGTWKG